MQAGILLRAKRTREDPNEKVSEAEQQRQVLNFKLHQPSTYKYISGLTDWILLVRRLHAFCGFLPQSAIEIRTFINISVDTYLIMRNIRVQWFWDLTIPDSGMGTYMHKPFPIFCVFFFKWVRHFLTVLSAEIQPKLKIWDKKLLLCSIICSNEIIKIKIKHP